MFKRVGGWCVVGVLALLCRDVVAATGAVDAGGYSWVDSRETGGPSMTWEDITTGGTSIWGTNWDDNVAQVNLGFTMPYYGVNYTSCNIASNGNVQMGSGAGNGGIPAIGTPFPSAGQPNGMIAPYLADLFPNNGAGEVFYRSFTDRFVVTWSNTRWYNYPDGAGTFTFQVKLFASGLVIFNYQNMAGAGSTGNIGSTGLENAAGTIGHTYQASASPNTLATNLSIVFSFGAAPNAPTGAVQTATSGGPGQPNNFISDASIFFKANVSDPDAGQQLRLEVEMLPSNVTFVPAVTGVVVTSPLGNNPSLAEATYGFGTPFGNGTYHWRCRTLDPMGKRSGWVVPANDTFVVDIMAPSAPTLGTPSDAQDLLMVGGLGGTVQFQWTPAADAGPATIASYDYEVAYDSGFTSFLSRATVTSPQVTLFVPVSGNAYFWRVATRDSAGNLGSFSPAFTFRAVDNDGVDQGAEDAKKACGMSVNGSAGMLAVLLAAAAMLTRRIR